MADNNCSAAILNAARKLYQFVLARELELIETTETDIENYIEVLGITGKDRHTLYTAALTEADQGRRDVPLGTPVLYAMNYEDTIITVWSHICDAHVALMDREAAVFDEWLRRVSDE